MTVEKKSKRQARREKMRKQEMRSRMTTIGLITAGALLLVIAFIWPQFTTIDDLIVPETTELPNPDGLSLGDPNAPAVIDVFVDFQCSACQFFTENVEPLIIEYLVATGKARMVYRHYPFLDGEGAGSIGESDQAANAAMCANEQDRFWDMHGMIFANWNGTNQGNFSNRRLQAMADEVDLDMDAFNACFSENRYREEIQADFDYGQEIGVSGTPSVFVNGQKVGEPGKIASFQEIAVAVDAIAGTDE
jgi:protein-disulfide isomerase